MQVDQNIKIEHGFKKDIISLCLWLPSRIDGKAGYGAVLLDRDDSIIASVSGGLGKYATVYQAECVAIIQGLSLCQDITGPLTILADNQAVVHSLQSTTTTT